MGETGKRNRGRKDNYGDGKNQRRRTEKEDKEGDELIAYRILCPATVIGSVIGKAGKVINSIRQETRAKVKVVDPFPGAKDRVITIYCYVKEKREVEVDEEFNNFVPLCPSQDALLRMHAAISDALANLGENDREECNILVPASQSANVIGKSGTTIKNLRSKTRANIKVVRKDGSDPNHSCGMDFDNFIQINGDPESVKRALFAISAIMYKFPPKEEIPLDTTVPEVAPSIIIPADMLLNPAIPASGFYSDPLVPPRSAPSLIDSHALELPVPGFGDTGNMWSAVPNYGGASPSEDLTVRVLCPTDDIGRVIGKGGSVIKSIRKVSGARIEVDDTKLTKDKCGGCLITITSTESLDDLQSKAVEAVLLLQEKINEDAENVTIRLLIPSRNIGCIIGKSGSIINEIRKRTRADIRISKGQKPKGIDEGDEYVEVSGEVKNVRDALVQIVLRLRDDALKDKDGANNPSVAPDPLYTGSSALSLPPVLHSFPPANPLGYEPRSESGGRGVDVFSSGRGVDMLSSGRGVDMLSNRRGIDMLSSGHGVEMLSSGHGVEMLSSSRGGDMLSSGRYKYKSLPMGDDGYGSSYSSKLYGGGLLPSSTLEILVPANAVSKVLGKNGANLSNIRQISGAVIEISEPRNSRGDRVAHISGTPEQKRSAENLIQAFIMAT